MAKKTGESCLAIMIKMTLLITIMTIIGFGAVYMAYNKLNDFFNRGGTIVVPDFRGKHLVEVMKMKPEGLEIVRRDEKFDPKLPKDHVIAQFPEPHTVVKPGKQIFLSVSLGIQKVIVPDLVGNAIREVEVALLNAQLNTGNRAYVFSADVPPDRVVGQSPMPSEEYGINKNVDLLISLGVKPETLPLPNLTGVSLETAKSRLKTWGFNLGKVFSTTDKGRARFRIISTSPAPYSHLRKGDTVNILISSGNDKGSATPEDLKLFEIYDGFATAKADMSGFKALTPMQKAPIPQVAPATPQNTAIINTANTPVNPTTNPTTAANTPLDAVNTPPPLINPKSPSGLTMAIPEKEISYMMPDGFMPKELKIIHITESGRKQIYSAAHKPLDLVNVKVPFVPNTKVQIYINDVPIEELKID